MPVYKCSTLISTPVDLLRVAGRVPRLSSVYSKVKLLASRGELSLQKIEREITRDKAVSARLPAIGRVMFPALGRSAITVSEVLPILGGERIRHLMLVSAVAAACRRISSKQFDMHRYWRLAARRALLARLLALEAPHVDPTRAFVAGIVSDIGHLVLHLGIPEPAADARMRAAQCSLPLHEVESDLLGFDFAQVGAALVRRWHHSDLIENAIEFQMHPLSAPAARPDACVLNIATRLAETLEAGMPPDTVGDAISNEIWRMAGRSREMLAQIADNAAPDFAELERALIHEPDISPATRPVHETSTPGVAVPIAITRARKMPKAPATAMSPGMERKAG